MRTSNIIDILCNGRNRRPADREMPSQSGRGPRNQHVNITPVLRITNWKKSVYTIIGYLLAVLAAVSCAKDDDTVTLHALMADMPGGGQKVYIDDQHYACWENGDQVAINGTSCTVAVVTDGNNREATMQVRYSESGYTGAYPADYVKTCTGGNVVLTMPSTQTVVMENGHQQIVAPMVGYTANDKPSAEEPLRFHNVAGVLKINVTNSLSQDLNIYALEIESSNAYIAGTGTVDGVDTPTPSLTISSDKTKNVMLMCNNVELANNGSADFYLVVAPFADPTQFTVHVLATGADNLKYTFHRESKSGITIARNQIGSISVDVISDYTRTYDEGNYFWGQGTPECPFIIATYGELDTLRHLVNHSDEYDYANDTIYKNIIHNDERYNSPTVYYRQVADIDLNTAGIYLGSSTQTSNWGYYTSTNGERDYNPIGDSPTLYFKANYDGGGHYIKNIYYKTGEISALKPGSRGIFGYAGDGSIKNLKVTGKYENTKDWSIGGIVGESVGSSLTIDNCTSEVIISSTAIITNSNGLGGIIGKVSSPCTITNCSFLSTISSTNTDNSCTAYLGGIVGLNTQDGTAISYCSCSNTSSISSNYKGSFGGICGITTAAISINNCTNQATITNSHNSTQQIYCGGILGNIDAANKTIDISNCTNNGTVSMPNSGSTSSYVGGIVGKSTNVSRLNISYCKNNASVSGYKYAGGILAYFFNAGTYNITNCANVEAVTGGDGVGGIVGNSNLNGCSISKCVNTGQIKGSSYNVGGIAGFYGYANISQCKNTGDVTGTYNVAGILGNSGRGTIDQCLNEGNITSTRSSSSDATAGGIMGYAYGTASADKMTIKNCGNTGPITALGKCNGGILAYSRCTGGVDVYNCYNQGNISSGQNAGGIVGYVNGVRTNISNCYFSGIFNKSSSNQGSIVYATANTSISACYANENCGANANGNYCKANAKFNTSSGEITDGTAYESKTDIGNALRAWQEDNTTYTPWTNEAIPTLNLTF